MKSSSGMRYLRFGTAVVLFIVCLFPFVWMLVIAFSKNPDFLSPGVSFSFTLQNFHDVVFDSGFHLLDFIRNSIVVSFLSALFATVLATLSAYTITRMKFPGRTAIPLALLGFSMFPQVSIVGYLFRMMTWFGWINTAGALVFPYMTLGLPLALWIMLSYFSQISLEYDHAALVDGATRFRILRSILFPIALPGIYSTFILVFIYSFNEFLFALLLTIDYNARTVPVGIALFEGLHGQTPWGHVMAAAVIAIVPIVVMVGFFQRYIITGLMQGSVKG